LLSKSLDILLLTTDKEIAPGVRAAVEPLAEKATVTLCRDSRDLKSRLSRREAEAGPQVVILDIDEDPKRLLFELNKVITGFANLRCVVVSQEFNEDLVLQAMQAGARHFLRKSSIVGDLGLVLISLLASETESTSTMGRVISVFSCGGGCGATTAAVNLAHELHMGASASALVVDLDEHYGSVARFLGVSGNYGIGHVLGRKGTVDKHLIETSVIRAGNGVDVLLSPAVAEADASKPLEYGNLVRVLDACCESHDYVIVDAPRLPRRAMAELASASWAAVVVFQLMVRDVAFAKSVVSFLTAQKMDPDRILPLANRVRKRGPLLRLEDSRRAIGLPSVCCVRNHWRKALKSMTDGRPLGLTARYSGLRRDYRKIAAQVSHWTTNGD
jgi:pilus assembly protein CpaE